MTAPITWAEATSPIYWSSIAINWNSAAKVESPSFDVDAGYTLNNIANMVASASYDVNAGLIKSGTGTIIADVTYATNAGYTSLGGFTLSASADFDVSLDESSTGILTNAVASASYDLDAGYINNVNYPETASIAVRMNYQNSDSFLWNDVSDITTTWTKVDYPN